LHCGCANVFTDYRSQGIEGGPQGDADFCRFIGEGERQGLRVQLFAGASYDYRFIRNCSATP
jgi:hypothetical protein